MPWKMNGEALVLEDGNPVWVSETGDERSVDYTKLSKTLSDVTRESVDRKEKLRALEAKYAAFKDIDNLDEWMQETTKARDMMAHAPDQQKAVEEQVASRVAAATKPLNEQLASAKQEAERLRQSLLVEKVGNAFARSEYVKKSLVDPALAADLFANRFYLNAEGKLVAKDESGRDLYGAEGNLATFDESIVHFVNASPYKGVLLKGNGASGSGGNPSPSGTSNTSKNPWKADSLNITEQNRIYQENPGLARNMMREAGIIYPGM